jgi:hypothetical protein
MLRKPEPLSGRTSTEKVTAARVFALHMVGAICATTLLVLAITVTLKLMPINVSKYANAFGLPVEEIWSAPPKVSLPVGSPADLKPRRKYVHRIYLTRRQTAPRPVLKDFTPPPVVVAVLEPTFADPAEAPVVACLEAEAITPPEPEFALPPRPRRGIGRVFALLTSPFRTIGGWLVRTAESAPVPSE